ncbi:hypothetical protein RYH80_02250 [Halobaculum sp. MBLA0147]|uniref:hypothetical protein n=1 Tax=Halobaculum sp. MBLA0147 TaxID=3079934 RepID=UPI003524172D
MCHHRDFSAEWTRADDEEESEAEPEPTADVDFEEAEDVEILTDGGDEDESAE